MDSSSPASGLAVRELHVLVVDDDAVAVNGLAGLLEMDGCRVTGTTSPREAADLLRRTHFDVLVTELEMPELHGVELLKIAKAHCPGMSIFVVSAYAASPTARVATQFGAVRIFGKPLHYNTLLAEIIALPCGPRR
jgi:DNA-binding NtrC family response regulator